MSVLKMYQKFFFNESCIWQHYTLNRLKQQGYFRKLIVNFEYKNIQGLYINVQYYQVSN